MTRDRDASGRPRNARPRDELGRPLERSGAEPVPEPPAMAPADALRVGQQLLDDGQPFHAHELFEAVWKATTGPERELWRGLAQLAVGLTHRARGNEVGARALLLRAADTLSVVNGAPYDVAVVALRRWTVTAADDPERAGPIPKLWGQAADDRA